MKDVNLNMSRDYVTNGDEYGVKMAKAFKRSCPIESVVQLEQLPAYGN
jgi:hypothetical protein